MKRNALFGLLITMILLVSAFPFVGAGTSGNDVTIDPVEVEENVDILDNVEPHYEIDELVEMGAASISTFDVKDKENPMASIYDLSWMERSQVPASSIWGSSKDENDDFTNATYLEDEDELSNNVTSTVAGNQITFNDQDYFLINLTVDGVNTTVDRLEVTIFSQDAVDKNASIVTQAYGVNFVFQQYQDADCEVTGKFHGNTSKIIIVPDGDLTLNFVYPIFLEFRSWNHSTLNYTVSVDITQVSGGDWDGAFGGGMAVNSTNRPRTMQSVNRSHDLYDWYDMTGMLTDNGLDTQRGDEVRFSLRVDVATEDRMGMYGYAGDAIYGQRVPTTTIMYIYLVWLNYTSQQLSVATIQGGNFPFVGILFGNDPYTVGFKAHADHVWFGCAPLQLWLAGTQAFAGAEGNAEVFYNLSAINAQIIPPNGPPQHNLDIQDYVFSEDEGPWMNVTDLDDHFSDPDVPHNDRLRYEVERLDADDEIQFEIDEETHMLSIHVTEENWHSNGIISKFKIRCYDWGPNWVYHDPDDLSVVSNQFTIIIIAVNDDAYIDQVDVLAGNVPNDHQPIHITIPQGFPVKSKKIRGLDNDTEDKNNLEYSHNGSTDSFSINVNGQYNFQPTNEDVGTTWIRVDVDDGHSPSPDDYCILVFHVTNRNDAPKLVSIEWRDRGIEYDNLDSDPEPTFRNVDEDIEINFTVEAYDPDIAIDQADKLTWNVGSLGWNVYPHPTDPMRAYLTYLPTNDDAILSLAETSLSVSDNQGSTSQEINIILYVDNVNDKPTILNINGEVPKEGKVTLDSSNGLHGFEDQPYVLTVEAEDIDPRDDVTFSTNDPMSWQQSPVLEDDFSRNFTIIPNQDMVGIHSLRITVRDEDGLADTILVTYEIVNTNDPPEKPRIRYDESVIRHAGNEISFWSDDVEDSDGDELTYIWNFGDGTGDIEGQSVIHNWSSDNQYYVTLTVLDPNGGESSEEITIIIVERPPDEVDPNLDTDMDGMTDIYEEENGLNKFDANDAIQDPDEDDFTNIEEFEYGSNPLDPKDHPPLTVGDDGGLDLIWIIIIVVVVLLLIGAVAFFMFMLMSKPQPIVQQQMYGRELPGQIPPGQLPPQQQVGQQQLAAAPQDRLPPAPQEEKPEEDDYLDSFMEEAHKQIEESSSEGSDEDNVWKPPVEEAEPEVESQVEDLFGEGQSPEVTGGPMEEQPAMAPSPPGIPKLPDLPPPPEL